MGVVVRRYILVDILIIITFPYSTCISSFFGSSNPISLFIFKCFFVLLYNYYIPSHMHFTSIFSTRSNSDNNKSLSALKLIFPLCTIYI